MTDLDLSDPLSSDLFKNRNGNEVYLIDEPTATALSAFYQKNAGNVSVYNSDDSLRAESKRLIREATSGTLPRLRKAIENIFTASTIQVSADSVTGTLTADISLASNQNKASYSSIPSDKVVVIKENAIRPGTFGRYFQYYTDSPGHRRPIFLIETESSFDELKSKLIQCPDSYEFTEVIRHKATAKYGISTLGCSSLVDLTKDFGEAMFSTVSSTDLATIAMSHPDYRDRPLIQQLATDLLHLRATVIEHGKFASLDLANRLKRKIDHLEHRELTGDNPFCLLLFKALTNLFLLFAHERTKGLYENSMAIACATGDRLLQAHCLRFINLAEGHGPFAEFCLRGATDIFRDYECWDHANYCANNLLLGKFYSATPVHEDFDELIHNSTQHIPNFRGVGILYSNASVAYLNVHKPHEAAKVARAGLDKPNQPIHTVGLEVNLLISQWLAGGVEDDDQLLRVAHKANRLIDHRYRFHLANIWLDLAVMAPPVIRSEILDIFNEHNLRTEKTVVSSSLSWPMQKLGLLATSATEIRPGLRGEFIKRHGLVPIIHHAWL